MADFKLIESCFEFDFIENEYLNLEKSILYQKISPKGVSICDFLFQSKQRLLITEVKCSAPVETSKYFDELKKKISDSLLLISSICLSRIEALDIDREKLHKLINTSSELFIILIVNLEKRHLISLQNKMNSEFISIKTMFGIKFCFVLNHENASKYGYAVRVRK